MKSSIVFVHLLNLLDFLCFQFVVLVLVLTSPLLNYSFSEIHVVLKLEMTVLRS